MEDDEGPKNLHDSPSPQPDIGLTIQDKPSDTVQVDDAVAATEQCQSVSAPSDSQVLASCSLIEARNDDAPEEKHDSPPLVIVSSSQLKETEASDVAVSVSRVGDDDREVEVGVKETEIPTDCSRLDGEAAEGEGEILIGRGDEKSKCEVDGIDKLQVSGVNCPNANEVAAGEIPLVGSGVDWENENQVETEFVGQVESSVGVFVSPSDESRVVGLEGGVPKSEPGLDDVEPGLDDVEPGLDDVKSTNVDGVNVGAVEILHEDNEMELGNEVETKELGGGVGEYFSEFEASQLVGVEGDVSKCEPELDELADVKSSITGEVVVDGSLQGRNAMELGNEVEMKETGGRVSKSEPGMNESEQADVMSPITGEVVVNGSLQGGNEMELQNEVEMKELDDSLVVGVRLAVAAKEDEDEDAIMKGKSGMEDVEMDKELEAEVTNEGGSTSVPLLDNSLSVDTEDNEGAEAEDEAPMVDTEMESEKEVGETPEADEGGSGGGKRKRGKVTKVPTKPPLRKKLIGEDVCFICFDGGDLVLCDRRGCPKAYHPSCVNRDEAFFRAKGRWNCGWHLCSHCGKSAHYMCYTCTFSLCKACIKESVFFCVRANKGFCETCMKTVMLIENNERASEEDRVNFDDKSCWEYLFKDYWEDLKAKLSLSADEVNEAKTPSKGSDVLAGKQDSPEEVFDATKDQDSGSESSENLVTRQSKRRKSKTKRKSNSLTKEEVSPSSRVVINAVGASIPSNTEWASKELLEFVMHMNNGDDSVLSQFDVQALLLEYIKRNKLRDPRKKSQIICDSRLENLFGKARVGHFEMLKLLESHFLVKEDSQPDDVQGTVVDNVVNHMEADGTIDAPTKGSKDRRRKMRRKGDLRGRQSNLGDYAAIDIHNISLIYLRRKLVEDLLEDIERFHDKVFGTFVRIRISGSNQNQDMYRLVQVVGTRQAAEPYKVGKKTTDLVLEILNLNKTEIVSIDTISNQEFTEDECKRLRQSIKCGLIERLTVGDILDKAMEIQAARVNDWLETETVRLSHLRDRASDMGHKKELRECVEKLQLLKTPEERMRRLEEVPKIHADPKMDPGYESEEDDTEMEDNKQEIFSRPQGSGFNRIGREPISPRRGNFSPVDSGSSTKTSFGKNLEANRNISNKDFPIKSEEATAAAEMKNENVWNQGRDREGNMDKVHSATNSETIGRDSHSFARSESFTGAAASQSSLAAAGLAETVTKINESEKIWHYQDPAGKIQGPFSLVQLRKWNSNGYFPVDLRIWRTTEKQDDSLVLTDALAGRFFQKKELPQIDNNSSVLPQTLHSPHFSSTPAGIPHGSSLHRRKEGGEGVVRSQMEPSSLSGRATPSVEVPKVSADRVGSDYHRNDSTNLPSPTPMSSTPRWTGGPTHSPSVATSVSSGQFTQSGSKEHTAVEPLGASTPHSVLSSGRESNRGTENDSSSSLRVPRSEQQGMYVGTTTALPASQTILTGESHGMIQPSVETQQWRAGSIQTQEMGAAPHQNAGTEVTQAWGGAAAQNSEPNPSVPAYGQWGGVPSTIQNPTGNFATQVFPAFPQPDPWRPPVVANNQPNVQPAAPPNVPWGMSVAQNNAFAPAHNNLNTVWVPMPGNPNMGWVGPAPGVSNMNWGAPVQGPINPGWVATTGNPGAMVQGIPPGNVNPGWAPQAAGNPGPGIPPVGNPGSGIQPANGNPGWVAPAGNTGYNVQGQAPGNVNPVWGTPNGNPGTPAVQGPAAPGNSNPGWGPSAPGNSGMRGDDKQQSGNNSFSGQRDNRGGFGGGGGRWNNNRQPSFKKGPNTVCPFHKNGRCWKGDKCDMLHT